MIKLTTLALCFLLSTTGISWAVPSDVDNLLEIAEWRSLFEQQSTEGTIVVLDLRHSETSQLKVSNAKRAQQRFLPASTFKIPNALIALEEGVVRDEFQIFSWDGKKRFLDAWNKDQTLGSAMRYSTVWLFQDFAEQIGRDSEQAFLEDLHYGNQKIGSSLRSFWLDDSLQISAVEQVEFLHRLYRNQLPFSEAHQQLIKNLMVNEATQNWVLRAKTGWGLPQSKSIGWFVGWLERSEGAVLFALNISMQGGIKDAFKRKRIAMDVLKQIGAIE